MNTSDAWLKMNGLCLKIPSASKRLLEPWDSENGLNATKLRRQLQDARPKIRGHKNVRICKDIVYKTFIQGHCARDFVHGAYLGLAAAHLPEIYAVLHQFLQDRFDSCQLGRVDFNLVQNYAKQVQEAYKGSWRGKFNIHYDDILSYMSETRLKYGVIDLDLMIPLGSDLVTMIADGVENCAEGRSVLAVWHTADRKKDGGDAKVKDHYRPMLKKELKDRGFRIVHWDELSYYEMQGPDPRSGFPMRVEVATLWRTGSRAA
jgi:hypothetical protein